MPNNCTGRSKVVLRKIQVKAFKIECIIHEWQNMKLKKAQ